MFSVKSDVFSFGVLVLEIISGRRNNLVRSMENAKHLLSFVSTTNMLYIESIYDT